MIKYLNGLGTTKVLSIQLLLLVMFCMGCAVPFIIHEYSLRAKEEKRVFMNDFNITNIERKRVGLPPLDLCTEKYHFDKGYAKDDPVCKKRVEAYEAGDETALGQPQLVEQTGTDEGQGKDEGMKESEEVNDKDLNKTGN